MRSLGLALAVGAALVAGGCGGDDDELELPQVDCDSGEIPGYGEVEAFTACTVCHASNRTGGQRNGAPDEHNFDTYASAIHEPEEVAHEVYAGAMPPPDSGLTLSEDEKQQLYRWALCGTPE